jgi:hypothetical protein
MPNMPYPQVGGAEMMESPMPNMPYPQVEGAEMMESPMPNMPYPQVGGAEMMAPPMPNMPYPQVEGAMMESPDESPSHMGYPMMKGTHQMYQCEGHENPPMMPGYGGPEVAGAQYAPHAPFPPSFQPHSGMMYPPMGYGMESPEFYGGSEYCGPCYGYRGYGPDPSYGTYGDLDYYSQAPFPGHFPGTHQGMENTLEQNNGWPRVNESDEE